MSKLRVLFATSEVAPLIKTGGLADVSGALPAALHSTGVDVRILLPGYPKVLEQLGPHKVVAGFERWAGLPAARLLSGTMANHVPLLVLDCPVLYQRDGGPYQNAAGQDWPDNALRFGLLSRVAALLASAETPLSWRPDLLHCNDWQAGLAPAYLRFIPGGAPTVITIHNLAFQGNFPAGMVTELGLPASSFDIEGVEFYGNLSFLKAGLFYADHITTVSPNYAREIQQELGFGMQGLLGLRSAQLTGILNGIDTAEWNPLTDRYLTNNYSQARMFGKALNKRALQNHMGLGLESGLPLLGVVSRFTHQKGLDLLLEIAPKLMELPVQLAMLGSGEAALQETARELSRRYPGRIAATIGFDEALSHQIEAGADIFVMPSRFEPCGLNQMYSQRYGTPPIVHATGGLADSVVDCTLETLKDGTASGFVFSGMNADNLHATVRRAISMYFDPPHWKILRKNCMAKDFSWQTSAAAYLEVYRKVLAQRAGHHSN